MSESSIGNYKGKKIMKEEEPNDEWINPTSDDNIILGNYVTKCLSDGPLWYKMSQEYLEGNSFDPLILALKQRSARIMVSLLSSTKISAFQCKTKVLPFLFDKWGEGKQSKKMLMIRKKQAITKAKSHTVHRSRKAM
nr:hypothetical protein [Tanacetum cinerariifolium]